MKDKNVFQNALFIKLKERYLNKVNGKIEKYGRLDKGYKLEILRKEVQNYGFRNSDAGA